MSDKATPGTGRAVGLGVTDEGWVRTFGVRDVTAGRGEPYQPPTDEVDEEEGHTLRGGRQLAQCHVSPCTATSCQLPHLFPGFPRHHPKRPSRPVRTAGRVAVRRTPFRRAVCAGAGRAAVAGAQDTLHHDVEAGARPGSGGRRKRS